MKIKKTFTQKKYREINDICVKERRRHTKISERLITGLKQEKI